MPAQETIISEWKIGAGNLLIVVATLVIVKQWLGCVYAQNLRDVLPTDDIQHSFLHAPTHAMLTP